MYQSCSKMVKCLIIQLKLCPLFKSLSQFVNLSCLLNFSIFQQSNNSNNNNKQRKNWNLIGCKIFLLKLSSMFALGWWWFFVFAFIFLCFYDPTKKLCDNPYWVSFLSVFPSSFSHLWTKQTIKLKKILKHQAAIVEWKIKENKGNLLNY